MENAIVYYKYLVIISSVYTVIIFRVTPKKLNRFFQKLVLRKNYHCFCLTIRKDSDIENWSIFYYPKC